MSDPTYDRSHLPRTNWRSKNKPTHVEDIMPGPQGVLKRLFTNLLEDLNISAKRWQLMMDAFLKMMVGSENLLEMSDERGNLIKDFKCSTMTEKVLYKMFMLLQFTHVELTIKATRGDGESVMVSTTMYVRHMTIPPTPMETKLPELYREIYQSRCYTPESWTQAIEKYLSRANRGTVGAVKKQLRQPTMTWKVFCKALWIMEFQNVDIYIKCFQIHGRFTEHHTSFILTIQ